MKQTLAVVLSLLLPSLARAQTGLFAEDSPHVSGQFGSFQLCVRKDTPTQLAGADGEYSPCITDASGRLWITGAVTQSGSWTVTASQGTPGTHANRWMIGLSDGVAFISPATDRTTAAGPFSTRLSDGTAFYDATKTGQLPSALVGGRLDVNLGAFNAITGSGTIAALNDAVSIAIGGHGAGGFQLVGGCTAGIVTFEGTVDGTNWTPVEVVPIGTQAGVTTATAPGTWTSNVGGLANIRARVSDACDTSNFTANVRATTAAARMFGSAAAGGTSQADNTALSSITGMGALFDTTPPAITDGNVGIPRMSTNRDLRTTPVDGQGDSAADDANNAVRVNVVAGGAGGGVAQTQVRNEGDTAWVNVGVGAEGAAALHMPVQIQDADTEPVAVMNAAPTSEFGLVTRNIPSGTQIVGAVATAASATFNADEVTVTVDMSADIGTTASFRLAAGTLTATILPECSQDGSNYFTGWFFDGNTLAWSQSLAVTNPNALTQREIVCPGGLQTARARVDLFTSGSASATATQSANPHSATFANLRNAAGAEIGTATDPVNVEGTVTANQGTPAATANRWPTQITDGTDLGLVTAAGEVNVLASAQPGVDIGDVTVNNASGASAVNIQDGGNSITVDGTVTANAGTGNFSVVGTKLNNGGAPGATNLGTLPAVANAAAPTQTEGNQVALRAQLDGDLVTVMEDELPAGTQNIGDVDIVTLPAVTQSTASSLNAEVQGDAASGAAKSGNPVQIGGVHNTTQPTVTTGQVVEAQATARGALIVASGVDAINVTPAANSSVNLNQVAGSAVTTVAAGTLEVGISDSTGVSFLSAANALNSTGAGLLASQMIGQFDDTAPTSITENQFGNLRMSANRNLFGTIRDAAGNERGANVNASSQLSVSVDNTPTVTLGAGSADAGNVNIEIGGAALSATNPVPTRASDGAIFIDAREIEGQNNTRPIFCQDSVIISTATSGNVELVALTGGQTIYVCGWDFIADGTVGVQLISGTGTACATGETDRTGVYSVQAREGKVTYSGGGSIVTKTTSGEALCIELSAAIQVNGVVSYAKF